MRYTFTVSSAPPAPVVCRSQVHGRHCKVPWGYDEDHTDQRRPYTLAELETRQECPHFYAYPSAEEYKQGFHLWRALRRDDRLTGVESDEKMRVLVEHMNARHGLGLDWEEICGGR